MAREVFNEARRELSNNQSSWSALIKVHNYCARRRRFVDSEIYLQLTSALVNNFVDSDYVVYNWPVRNCIH